MRHSGHHKNTWTNHSPSQILGNLRSDQGTGAADLQLDTFCSAVLVTSHLHDVKRLAGFCVFFQNQTERWEERKGEGKERRTEERDIPIQEEASVKREKATGGQS